MPLSLHNKKEIVSKIHHIANIALSIVIADSRGVTTNNITELRKLSRNIGVTISIVRNTLLNLAIQGTSFECLKNKFKGPTLVAYSLKHPGSGARLFKDFSKKNKNFKITGGVFEEKILSTLQVHHLADMPTYNEAIIIFISLIKEAAVGKLIRTVFAISNKKEKTLS
ncbi:50S ribosomal protein L10 [Buchnera aphidicola]|uniref:50S ribosomal protein L10 n=1 Tax=Buchnera aphidicola TaxID=9 RepID=UPI0034641062